MQLAGHCALAWLASRIGVDADGVVDVRYGRVEWQHVLASYASQCLEEHLGVFVCACVHVSAADSIGMPVARVSSSQSSTFRRLLG